MNFSIINITAARINNQAFFARKPTASPAVLKTKLAIAPIIPGKISPIFFPIVFNAPPTPFPRLVSPFWRLLTITPITKPTADTTANTVKPYFLKIALTRSLRLIRSSIISFSASSLEISFCCCSILASICSLWFPEAVSREACNSCILFSRLEISSRFVSTISSARGPRDFLIFFDFFISLSFTFPSASIITCGTAF